jgi:RimJ/RimL family protein N-acetyltransferase
MLPGLLRGARVRLTALDKADLSVVTTWFADDATLRHFDAVPAMPRTAAQVDAWLDAARTAHDRFLFAIRLFDEDAPIGLVELDGILWPHRTAWLSILIGPHDARRKGYGSEAIQLVLRFAFEELNLYRIALTVFSYNQPAIALYERLGFQREGAHRAFLERDGRRHDMVLYGLLRPEWEARRQLPSTTPTAE